MLGHVELRNDLKYYRYRDKSTQKVAILFKKFTISIENRKLRRVLYTPQEVENRSPEPT